MTKVDGTVYDSMDYLPFGEQISGGSGSSHKFTGKERDSESGLDNFGARYMSSNLGRFMSADEYKYVNPADPQSLNLYGYVANNPVNAIDPTGHAPEYMLPHKPYMHADGGGGPTAYGSGGSVETQFDLDTLSGITVDVGADGDGGSGTQAQRQQTAQQIANKIPQTVKNAIQASLDASNAPSACACDFWGGFHEESGIAGTDKNGNLVIAYDEPGPVANPDIKNLGPHTSGVAADQEVTNSITTPTVNWHIHPKGESATNNFKQEPSDKDRAEAIPNAINLVVGARDKNVYFYDSSNHVTHMTLAQFMRSGR